MKSLQAAVASEFVVSAHTVASDPQILAEMSSVNELIRQITQCVDLTEAPEEAVCALVLDLLHYCERERINWSDDVMVPALKRYQQERLSEASRQ